MSRKGKIMSVINNLKFQYHLKTLTAGIYELEQEMNVEKIPSLIEKNEKNIHAIEKYVNDNKLNEKFILEDDDLHYLFLINKHEYMKNYYEKNYNKAFNNNYSLFLTSINSHHKSHYLLASLESLTQIKSHYLSLGKWFVYKKKYDSLENNIMEQTPFLFNLEIGEHGSLKNTTYNNSRLSLAYLHFLEQNTDISKILIQEQFQKYGQATVIYKETEEQKSGWLNNERYSQQFIDYLNDNLSIENKNSLQTKPKNRP